MSISKEKDKTIYVINIKNDKQETYVNYVQSGFIGTIESQDKWNC